VVTGGAMPAKKEGDFEMTEEPKIALPTPVMIRTNSLSEAWALAVYACSHEGKPSSPDYKNTPTLRMNMKLTVIYCKDRHSYTRSTRPVCIHSQNE